MPLPTGYYINLVPVPQKPKGILTVDLCKQLLEYSKTLCTGGSSRGRGEGGKLASHFMAHAGFQIDYPSAGIWYTYKLCAFKI
eukprot:SAG31_NODE_19819_length_591_cov_0.733740_1_plen_82_part_10